MMIKQAPNQKLNQSQQTELLALSRSYSGYTRESAVIELESYPSEKTIDALIERANDWVPQVRRAAQNVLLRICNDKTVPYFINQLHKIYHLKECKREDHTAFVNNIQQLLLRYNVNALTTLNKCDSVSALLYTRLLKKSGKIDLLQLAHACLEHSHMSVRLYAVSLSSKLEETQGKALQLKGIEDKSGIVRRNALRLLLRHHSESSYRLSLNFLYDKEKSVRSQALFYLKNNGFKCKQAFIEQLSTENLHRQRVAIWGLTELFAKSAVDLIFPSLHSTYPSIRTLALKACFVLCEEDLLEEIVEKMLNDNSSRVMKECSRLYKKNSVHIGNEALIKAINSQANEKNYRYILKMTHTMNKWEQLILLSEISRSANSSLRTEIEKTLQLWVNKLCNFFIDPTQKQIDRIKTLDKNEKRYWPSAVEQAVHQRCGF